MKRFKTKLAVPKGRGRGFGGDGTIEPGQVAIGVFGPDMDGNLLFSYLFRRFGFPNIGWDDHKDLVQYCLATPIPGLYLRVTPRPVLKRESVPDASPFSGTTVFMFGVFFDEKVTARYQEALDEERRPYYEHVRQWSMGKFVGTEVPDEEGYYKTESGQRVSLVLRDVQDGEEADNLPEWKDRNTIGVWREIFAQRFRVENPDFDYSQIPRIDRTAPWKEWPRDFFYEVNEALETTLLDLRRPTSVRDYVFNVEGPVRGAEYRSAEVYKDAGCTAEYLVKESLKKKADKKPAKGAKTS